MRAYQLVLKEALIEDKIESNQYRIKNIQLMILYKHTINQLLLLKRRKRSK